MSTADNRRITLTFEAGVDPIRGSIEHADGSNQPFWGWLELSEKLGRVASTEPERPLKATATNRALAPDANTSKRAHPR